MRPIDRLQTWLRARRARRGLEREARRRIADLFDDPRHLRGTSLRPEHRSRVVMVRHDVEQDRVARVFFTILRHPRPYAFSRQVHEVLELWRLDVDTMRAERIEGSNLSRARGTDGEPSTYGPGI